MASAPSPCWWGQRGNVLERKHSCSLSVVCLCPWGKNKWHTRQIGLKELVQVASHLCLTFSLPNHNGNGSRNNDNSHNEEKRYCKREDENLEVLAVDIIRATLASAKAYLSHIHCVSSAAEELQYTFPKKRKKVLERKIMNFPLNWYGSAGVFNSNKIAKWLHPQNSISSSLSLFFVFFVPELVWHLAKKSMKCLYLLLKVQLGTWHTYILDCFSPLQALLLPIAVTTCFHHCIKNIARKNLYSVFCIIKLHLCTSILCSDYLLELIFLFSEDFLTYLINKHGQRKKWFPQLEYWNVCIDLVIEYFLL